MEKFEVLRVGSKGKDVKKWQVFLIAMKLLAEGQADEKFGPKTEKATKEYQELRGLWIDGFVGKNTIKAAEKDGFEKTEHFSRYVDELIIHITASNPNATVEDLRRQHMQNNGWSDIGYHWVMTSDGVLHEGRPEEIIGAGVLGNNATTIHISYVSRGNDYDNDSPYGTYMTDAQKREFPKAVAGILKRRKLTISDLTGHNDYDSGKACPCFKVRMERKFLEDVQENLAA